MGSTFPPYARTLTYLPKIIMNKSFWIAFVTIAFVIVSRSDANDSVNAAGAVEAVEAEFDDLRAKVEALSTPCEAMEELTAKLDNLTELVKSLTSTPLKPKIITDEGTPGASSEENADNVASRAFTNSAHGDYWANLPNQFPAAVWMNYLNKHSLAKIGIRHNWVSSLDYAPKKFEIIASNDCSSWTILLTVENGGYTHDNQMKTWVIPTQYRSPFSCIGVRWPKKVPTSSWVTVSEIVMWEMVA